MKYFRIGYCPPNPGPWSKAYKHVRAYNENEIASAIQYAKEHPSLPIYMKGNYGAKYIEKSLEYLIDFYETRK